jgi:hypothetical protein
MRGGERAAARHTAGCDIHPSPCAPAPPPHIEAQTKQLKDGTKHWQKVPTFFSIGAWGVSKFGIDFRWFFSRDFLSFIKFWKYRTGAGLDPK